MATYVLVHGAWHSGESWERVRDILEANNHKVYTPTMTGLGDRTHFMSASISMRSLVDELVDLIETANLKDIILVGHSFGGAVISGVLEAVFDRIERLVYFDAAILENGESMFACMPEPAALARQKLAQETSGGISLPVPSAQDFGGLTPEQWQYLVPFLSPHPLSTYNTLLILKAPPGEGVSSCYIVCNAPLYQPLFWARNRAKKYGWPMIPLQTGHEAMITLPNELSDILMNLDLYIEKNS